MSAWSRLCLFIADHPVLRLLSNHCFHHHTPSLPAYSYHHPTTPPSHIMDSFIENFGLGPSVVLEESLPVIQYSEEERERMARFQAELDRDAPLPSVQLPQPVEEEEDLSFAFAPSFPSSSCINAKLDDDEDLVRFFGVDTEDQQQEEEYVLNHEEDDGASQLEGEETSEDAGGSDDGVSFLQGETLHGKGKGKAGRCVVPSPATVSTIDLYAPALQC